MLPLTLDVTDREAVFASVEQANEHFGRLDVIVNNAGYGHFGMIEEVTEAEARTQIETNLFGALWVMQAVLPILREQGGGHILSVSSIGGIVAFPGIELYHASKWALEAMNDALSQEVAAFGIKVTLIEPGGYATDWGGSSAVHSEPHPAYQDAHDAMMARRSSTQPGDPDATADAIFAVVDTENPPLRLFLGSVPLTIARPRYAERLATWEAWADVSNAAQGNQ